MLFAFDWGVGQFVCNNVLIQLQALVHVQNIESRLKGIRRGTMQKPRSVALSVEGHVNYLLQVKLDVNYLLQVKLNVSYLLQVKLNINYLLTEK